MLALGAMILLPPLFFFLYAALAIVIVSCAYELLARKYDARVAAQQQATDTEHINTLSAARDTQAARAREEYDEYLDRGFRDFSLSMEGVSRAALWLPCKIGCGTL